MSQNDQPPASSFPTPSPISQDQLPTQETASQPTSHPQTPTSPSSSKKSGFLKTFFTVIALILFGVLIGVIAARFLPLPTSTQTPTPTPTPSVSITPTPTVDETADWKTFNDDLETLSFKYPNQYTIETRPGDDGKAISYLFAKDYLITLDVFSKYTSNQVEFYYDSPSNGKLDIGGILWNTYYLPTGYGDGAVGSGQPIFGLQTELNKHLLRVTLFNQKTITEEQKQIFATFKFTDNTSSNYSCPSNGWVDCMPVLDAAKTIACSTEAMAWYKANCPNFKGAAL